MKILVRVAERKDVKEIVKMISKMLEDVGGSDEHKKFELRRCTPKAIEASLGNIFIAMVGEKSCRFYTN